MFVTETPMCLLFLIYKIYHFVNGRNFERHDMCLNCIFDGIFCSSEVRIFFTITIPLIRLYTFIKKICFITLLLIFVCVLFL
jgi:hypothetical protein